MQIPSARLVEESRRLASRTGMLELQYGFANNAKKKLARAIQRRDVSEREVGYHCVEEFRPFRRELGKNRGHLSLRWL